MPEDAELLREYAERGSEAAFAALVARRIDLVYSVALRQCGGDAHLAADVVQQVFTALARKAAALSARPVLSGWLYRSARFAASDLVRAERRRRARESEAQTMNENASGAAHDAEWAKLRPVLDEALSELGEPERDAVLLRFFEGRAFREIGAALRLSEDAARMRVERALEKLGRALASRGVTSTSAALGVALGHQGAIAAPAGLAATVASTATAAVGTLGVAGTFLAMSKIKIGIVSAIVVASLTTAVIEVKANRALRAELKPMSGQAGEDRVVGLQRENQRLSAQVKQAGERNPEIEELAWLRNRIAALKARPPGVVDAELLPPRNAGRDSPAAAVQTFCWAVDQDKLDLVAPHFRFSDDTPENRAAFMANFSEAIRARYRTPERLLAAASFGIEQNPPRPNPNEFNAVQVVTVVEDHSADQVKVNFWYRTADGREAGANETYQRYADGWAGKALSLQKPSLVDDTRRRLDPATGDWIPPEHVKR